MKGSNSTNAVRDYLGFLAYLLPCVAVIAFARIVLVPRFEKLLEVTRPETQRPNGELPPVLGTLIGIFEFFFQYFWLVVPPLIVGIVLVEAFSKSWRSARRRVFGALRWLIVFATMLALLMLVTATLAVTPIDAEQ